MKLAGDLKDFDDPLFPSIKRVDRQAETETAVKATTPDVEERRNGDTNKKWILGGVFTVLAVLAVFLFVTYDKVQSLNGDLNASQNRLSQVSQELQASQEKIGNLQSGLDHSQARISTQSQQLGQYQAELGHYRNRYEELKSGQEQHSKDLQTIQVKKADQTQVETLEGETEQIRQQVTGVNSSIADLKEQAGSNRRDIEGTRQDLAVVKRGVDGNTQEIASVKRSLERETYGFELQKNAAIMKVFDISLKLKDVNASRQRFDLEIFNGTKRIKRDDHNVNVPIYFYVDGMTKPYEIVVTKVNRKYVAGYLSVPKKG